MSLPPYQYEPLQGLDAVRVLVLKPSPDFAAELECDVVQYSRLESLCSLDTTTQYSAVSYAWGEPVFTHHIRCASTATPSRISITANADGMLRHLRHLADARYLWIDAICLNQADEAEKAAQIPLMDQIYQQARAVHVWLGPDQGDAKAVFALIRSLATVPDDPTDEADHVAGLIEKVLGNAANRVLCAFWDLPWFTRRWVLQEVLLAQQAVVHYGREQLPWLGLTLATKKLGAASTNKIVSIPMHPSVNALGALSKFRQGSNHLLELIWEFDDWQCSDPRDRIFALHGLCHKGRTGTLPAYTLSWVDVYTRFTQACIDQGYQSAILMHLAAFGSLNNRDGRLPSWVPDWSLVRKNFRLPGRTEIPKTKLEEYGIRRRSLIPRNERSLTKSGECVFGVRHRGSVIKVMQQGTSWQHTRRLFYLFSAANSWANSGSIEQLLQYTALGIDHTDGAWTRALGRFHTIIKQNSVQPLPLALPEEEDLFRLVHEILSEYSLTITDRGVFGYVSPIFHGWSGLDIYDLVPLTGPREKLTSMDWRVALVAFQPSLKHEAFDSTVHQDSDQIYWDRKIHGICLHGTETTFATGTKELIVS